MWRHIFPPCWKRSRQPVSYPVFLLSMFQFTQCNFNLLTAISIYPMQFQFAHGNFNYGNFNFAHGDFAILLRRQFQFSHGNAHGIFGFSHHLSATAAESGQAPKVKRKIKSGYLKSIFKGKSENHKSKVDLRTSRTRGYLRETGRTQTGMSSYRSPYISFHVFTDLKMNSDRSDFIPVADPTRVTFVPVWERTVLI